MPSPDVYPIESRVVLKGLLKAPELNGKIGVVKSGLFNGRQHVMVEGLNKSVALKVSNMSWEGRSVDSLSVKELKTILKAKAKTSDSELSGIDKSELQSKLASLDASPETIAQWLVEAKTAVVEKENVPTSSPSMSVDPAQAASQLANMDPEQLRQQARMLRSMPPDQIRRMNPQMAAFSDAQIQAAASQMEMMASNPAMMKMAAEQMKNMSPEEIQRAQQQAMGGAIPPTTSSTSAAAANIPSASQTAQAANMMQNMTPEQLRQQADMFSAMPPDQIRQMNPQLAHMTDEQFKAAASQLRMMADNPEMMKMAADQMKNMTPEQLEEIRNGSMDPSFDPSQMMGADPSKMLANLDKKQLKTMLKTLKENPEMMKQFADQFAASTGLGEDQLARGVEMFADMDDAKIDMAVNMMQKAQKAKDLWASANAKTGGHLMKILILLFLVAVAVIVKGLFFSATKGIGPDVPNIAVKETATEDEFEF